MHQEGFSLIELLIIMCVIAVGLSLAAPSFTNMAANERMATAVNDLVTSLHAARSEAIKRHRPVIVCASSDPADDSADCDPAASFADGGIVLADTDRSGARSAGDVLVLRFGAMSDALTVTTDADDEALVFDPLGRVVGVAEDAFVNVQVCDARGDRDTGNGVAAGRWIRIDPIGRISLQRERAAIQSTANPLGGCG